MCLWHSGPAEWDLTLRQYAWAQGVLDPEVYMDHISVKCAQRHLTVSSSVRASSDEDLSTKPIFCGLKDRRPSVVTQSSQKTKLNAATTHCLLKWPKEPTLKYKPLRLVGSETKHSIKLHVRLVSCRIPRGTMNTLILNMHLKLNCHISAYY